MLAHEMIHQFNNEIRNVQDTSSAGGRYHNRFFAEECKKHGLTAWKTNWNGYSRTVASQEMRDWIRASEENPTDHKRGQRKSVSRAEVQKGACKRAMIQRANQNEMNGETGTAQEVFECRRRTE